MNFINIIKKIKLKIPILLFLFISINCISQNSFIKKISNTYGLSASHAIQSLDNGYVAIGNYIDSAYIDTANNIVYTSDIFIIKFNNFGDSLWSFKYGGIKNEFALKILETNDSNLYFLAIDSLNNGLLLKFKSNGNLIWMKKYTDVHLQQIIYKQNTLYLLGETNSNSSSNIKIEIIKCDTSGNIITQKSFGFNSNNIFFVSSDTISNNGYFVLGKTNATSVLYKLNDQLDTLWTKTYFNINYRPVKIINTDNNSAIIIYNYGTLPVQNLQPRAIKVNISNGNIIWQQNYFDNQNYDAVSDMIRYNNDETLICGMLNNNLIGDSNQMFVLIIDKNGNELFLSKKNMLDTTYFSISSMQVTTDNALLLAGTKDNTMLVYKAPNSFVPIYIDEKKNNNKDILVYPNPVKNILNINLTEENLPANIIIYNINGKEMHNSILNKNLNIIKTENLKSGIYFYFIKTKEILYKGKMLKIE